MCRKGRLAAIIPAMLRGTYAPRVPRVGRRPIKSAAHPGIVRGACGTVYFYMPICGALERVVDTKWANVQRVKGSRARMPRCETGAQPVRFEGYGPGGAAVLVECLTEDRERARAEVRRTFREHGGQLGADGAVGYLFDHVGLMRFAPGADARRLTEAALAAGAEAVQPAADETIEVVTDPEELEAVSSQLTQLGFTPLQAEVTERASLRARLTGEMAERLLALLGALADLDDVWSVYSNVEIPDPLLARL